MFLNFYILGYVEDMYQSFLVAHHNGQLSSAIAELKTMTPKPMNSMLEKQNREEAMKIREQRKRMDVVDVPPTASGMFVFALRAI